MGAIGFTGPFWIYFKRAADKKTFRSVAVFLVRAVILLIFAAFGNIGSIKKSKILLLKFSIINIIMLLFGIAQIIVTNVVDCENDPDNSFSFLCSNSEGAYYAPMILLLAVNLCGAVFGLILRYVIVHDTKGNYY
ncbi:hypothetical protein DDB_G0295689 [Dictyostelium discoideum AX4]|uniref:Uncharacterized transmembrane protein DDB_G0295689 n=1 Tax=Dictyostelium discoideum TaxID=44689 RepID=Y8738_DICDI|nr:hypothetical protein DDB_G0295689 [Dictyostelium discoideum AX4]B0G162.1 RecName: Full=Uncharacterized transmembrane protein DDB_G0295689 [Dictyostelium discoideum]EDR41047.1 hypothetical protein DDB_G0295689 [Dictyostelium discoideum AX4]|eukprot:XP_001733025.1 hypothetical protein DDB_G0295689 [Dictyostelium discoideum AX4]